MDSIDIHLKKNADDIPLGISKAGPIDTEVARHIPANADLAGAGSGLRGGWGHFYSPVSGSSAMAPANHPLNKNPGDAYGEEISSSGPPPSTGDLPYGETPGMNKPIPALSLLDRGLQAAQSAWGQAKDFTHLTGPQLGLGLGAGGLALGAGAYGLHHLMSKKKRRPGSDDLDEHLEEKGADSATMPPGGAPKGSGGQGPSMAMSSPMMAPKPPVMPLGSLASNTLASSPIPSLKQSGDLLSRHLSKMAEMPGGLDLAGAAKPRPNDTFTSGRSDMANYRGSPTFVETGTDKPGPTIQWPNMPMFDNKEPYGELPYMRRSYGNYKDPNVPEDDKGWGPDIELGKGYRAGTSSGFSRPKPGVYPESVPATPPLAPPVIKQPSTPEPVAPPAPKPPQVASAVPPPQAAGGYPAATPPPIAPPKPGLTGQGEARGLGTPPNSLAAPGGLMRPPAYMSPGTVANTQYSALQRGNNMNEQLMGHPNVNAQGRQKLQGQMNVNNFHLGNITGLKAKSAPPTGFDAGIGK